MHCSNNKQDENSRRERNTTFTASPDNRNGGGWLQSEHAEKRELREIEKQGCREGRTRGSREVNKASMET